MICQAEQVLRVKYLGMGVEPEGERNFQNAEKDALYMAENKESK